MEIFCTGCNVEVKARLVDANEIYGRTYPGKFWICDCGAYVGTHYKTKNPTRPLGVLSTADIRKAKIHIHALIDPLWKKGYIKRGSIYKKISKAIGYDYHTGEIRSIEEARRIYRESRRIARDIYNRHV